MTEPTTGRLVEPAAVRNGALAGLLVVVPVSIVLALLRHLVTGFEGSGWDVLVQLPILFGYAAAGYGGGRLAPEAPLANGSLAGLATVVGWLPLRVLIWAVAPADRGLVSGHQPILTVTAIFAALVLSATFGMLGALVARDRLGPTPRRR